MIFKKKSIGMTTLMSAIILVGCETTDPKNSFDVSPPLASLKSQKKLSPAIAHIIKLAEEEKYSEASSVINQSLQSQPKNVALHLLNGLIYEKLGEHGDASGNELAAVGYQNAINLDPSNVFAITQLGKLKYREQMYDQAQEHFANALLIKPGDVTLWQELAAASYYSYDLKTALASIEKALELQPEDPLIHRSATMIYAALGEFNTAKKHLEAFKKKAINDPAVDHLAGRLQDWESLYNSGRIQLATATSSTPTPNSGAAGSSKSPSAGPNTGGSGEEGSSEGDSSGGESSGTDDSSSEGASAIDAPTFAKKVLDMPLSEGMESDGDTEEKADGDTEEKAAAHDPQIVIDCYILRITEQAITSKGNNILENLAVTLTPGGYLGFKGSAWGSGLGHGVRGDTVAVTADKGFSPNQANLAAGVSTGAGAASSFSPSSTAIAFQNAGSISGRVFTAGLTWAGLTYSLNIANAIDNRTEVVSRPSLMTFLKKPSVFFSGQELVNGFTGQYGGTLTKYPVGTTLEITPESLQGDLLSLTIGVEGSLLTTPNPNLLTQTIQIGKTRVDTFVKLRLGETLMLGGIFERQELSAKSGFPGLQDVPILQYFFSNETTSSARSSIVIMLTPRSPNAVKVAVDRAMTRQKIPHHVTELVSRNPNWFSTHPNLVSIFRYLNQDPVIYYEFRSGDVLPPSWGWEPPLRTKLAQLSSFLYF